eukprot:6296239-Karenia_brevis.AAC.1
MAIPGKGGALPKSAAWGRWSGSGPGCGKGDFSQGGGSSSGGDGVGGTFGGAVLEAGGHGVSTDHMFQLRRDVE